MSGFIPPPKRSYGSSAVLACDHDRGVLVLDVQRTDVDRGGEVICRPFGLRSCCRRSTLALQHIQACGLRDAVVVRGATATSLSATRAIAPPSPGARPSRCLVRCNVGRTGSVGKQRRIAPG